MSASSGPRVAIFSSGIRNTRFLKEFLEAGELVFRPRDPASVDVVAGWGNKATAERAREFAERHGKPYWRLEDGFLRSVGSGPESPPLSLIVDDLGIYYDARKASRLETWLERGDIEAAEEERALVCLARVREARLSKYNDQSTQGSARLDALGTDFVLVVDQTFGDAAITYGAVPSDGFARMLEAALDEHPDRRVVVKTHPDVIAGRKRGYLTETSRLSPAARARVSVIGDALHPHLLIERSRAVYVCTSQLGFEALLLGKPVRCFGMPFYAGWGLTRDLECLERRSARPRLGQLVAAAWLRYPRYVHPVRGERCSAEEIIEHLALQRRRFAENARPWRAYGFARWKQRYVARYLESPDARLAFGGRLSAGESALFWGPGDGTATDRTTKAAALAAGAAVLHMEDGFLRSVGLGSDLTEPRSLCLDARGPHYDPAQPSELEELLRVADFDADQLARAARLREAIVAAQLSKYNASRARPLALATPAGQRVVLVPGQVESDVSVRLGGAGIATNAELLRRVRRERPDAFLLYKPHPDVVSGNRPGRLRPSETALADHIESEAALPACLGACDEVHTLTSLVGFEALLRGLPVTTYGQPFYAGWGLTEDQAPLPRRGRPRTLDELVCATLLEYPRYYSFRARAFVTAEDVVFELARDREARQALAPSAPRALRQLERLGRWCREVLRAR